MDVKLKNKGASIFMIKVLCLFMPTMKESVKMLYLLRP
jgi:hypothetical protein